MNLRILYIIIGLLYGIFYIYLSINLIDTIALIINPIIKQCFTNLLGIVLLTLFAIIYKDIF